MDHLQLLAAAYVRGYVINYGGSLCAGLLNTPLDELTDAQAAELAAYGKQHGMKMYRFKEKDDLPRVRAVLGFLRAVSPESALDVGSGRGAFLFPFLRDFPDTPVTSLDILPYRAAFLQMLRDGGITRLTAVQADICAWDAPDGCFDVVTLLEVLEHIPDAERAIVNAARLCRRYIVVSVPSKPDNNPEHIHLLTKDRLTALFNAAGIYRLHFSGVNGHLFLTATKE
ncbi:MAG: class I SAM-dependent methyltransferase [Ruminococcus sp.]|nr:class I SAM-dependent methyltransferase [Ruminococcus sp.]